MNFAFLGKMIPDSIANAVSAYSKNNMQEAANALQWHIYNGLCQNIGAGIHIINVLPIGSFPKYYKRAFVKRELFQTDYNEYNLNIGFCNIRFLRNYILPFKIERALLEWCGKSDNNRVVFVYTLSLPFIKAIEKVKKKYPSLIVCAIVADLPNMISLSSSDNKVVKLFRKMSSKSCYAKLEVFDAYVLLTKQMADYMRIKQPYCVVEGIATKPLQTPNFSFSQLEKRMILYTGTLHKRFGILNLVKAFMMIPGENYELVICGIGDSEDEINKAVVEDKRISFLGQKSRKEILELQQEAYILVNPRQNIEEYTKYSFPSKNLEYLSSGRPLVAYKLDGIPQEYDEFIFYVKDNTISSLAEKIIEVCELPTDILIERCEKAYSFVQNEKNEIKQTEIILNMLNQKYLTK